MGASLKRRECGSLAQLVEQFPFKELVDGSNPSRPTISFLCNQWKVHITKAVFLYVVVATMAGYAQYAKAVLAQPQQMCLYGYTKGK
jgi:hypothetical protein